MSGRLLGKQKDFSMRLLLQTVVILGMFCSMPVEASYAKPIRVVVWDERQEAQKQVYPNYLGNALADHLRTFKDKMGNPEFVVQSVSLKDPDQGLSDVTLDNCDVLLWWGHARHSEVTKLHVASVVNRIKAGKLSLFALHSAHFSEPFVHAMEEKAKEDALNSLPKGDRMKVIFHIIEPHRGFVDINAPLTPSFTTIRNQNGTVEITLKAPICCFPDVREDGKPSHVTVLLPDNPIARGVPLHFDINHTEMYSWPFHVPKPEFSIIDEKWDMGEHFTSGSLWKVGKGEVFYFRPGHETFPVFKEAAPLKIVENATRYLGRKRRK